MSKKLPFANRARDTILVVEDDVIVRTALSEYLRHCGYVVIEAASETEAKQVFTEAEIKI